MAFLAVMPMPKAAVHEYAGSVFTEHDVWMSRQAWMVYPIPETMRKQVFAHNHLRLGVP